MEMNKIIAGVTSTLLVFMVLGFAAELIYHPGHGHAENAYLLEVEDDGAGASEEEAVDIGALFAAADPAAGEKTFKKCGACHKLEEGANAVGPTLWGVVDRKIASVDGFGYSGALPAGEIWTPENLFHFLEKPKSWAPGTSMSFAGIKDGQDRANLIAYLNEADGSPDPLPTSSAAATDEKAGDEDAPKAEEEKKSDGH